LNASAVNIGFASEPAGHFAILVDLGFDAQTVHVQSAQRRP
jgi:hypothetical protein